MPVVQAPIDKGKNRYAIAYAFRPGESVVRLSYDLPYPNNTPTVKLPTTYGGAMMVVAPPRVPPTWVWFQMAAPQEGINIYVVRCVASSTGIKIALCRCDPPAA